MGAWGAEPFDNDDALDLLNELEDSADVQAVDRVLREAFDDEFGAAAVAAAAFVAALAGEPPWCPSDDGSGRRRPDAERFETFEKIVATQAESKAICEVLRTLALATLDKIVDPDCAQYEVRGLWAEGGPELLAEWKSSVDELRASLSGRAQSATV